MKQSGTVIVDITIFNYKGESALYVLVGFWVVDNRSSL